MKYQLVNNVYFELKTTVLFKINKEGDIVASGSKGGLVVFAHGNSECKPSHKKRLYEASGIIEKISENNSAHFRFTSINPILAPKEENKARLRLKEFFSELRHLHFEDVKKEGDNIKTSEIFKAEVESIVNGLTLPQEKMFLLSAYKNALKRFKTEYGEYKARLLTEIGIRLREAVLQVNKRVNLKELLG